MITQDTRKSLISRCKEIGGWERGGCQEGRVETWLHTAHLPAVHTTLQATIYDFDYCIACTGALKLSLTSPKSINHQPPTCLVDVEHHASVDPASAAAAPPVIAPLVRASSRAPATMEHADLRASAKPPVAVARTVSAVRAR
ncbi:hypothetical protein E2C01_055931 [Portunus trituberculatus]|uniref:Uncharacterized protein n=1 Tax=Portunus trituberculatus TaxID=210409 RepID=A0A5B7GYZ2_PORTR|nr:hypothetical protein [Portunus trituberculatus]